MVLVVEDGTGKADAASYVDAAGLAAYAAANGYDLGTADTARQEQALRKATRYLDTFRRYKGQRLVASQRLEFPRSGLSDWSGLVVEGVPARVMDACCELAVANLAGVSLYQNLDRGGAIRSESVGPISVTYADGAPAGMVFAEAENLVAPFVRDLKSIRPAPFFGAGDLMPAFEISGMDIERDGPDVLL